MDKDDTRVSRAQFHIRQPNFESRATKDRISTFLMLVKECRENLQQIHISNGFIFKDLCYLSLPIYIKLSEVN